MKKDDKMRQAEQQALAAALETARKAGRAAGIWQNIAEFSAADFPFLSALKNYSVARQAVDLRAPRLSAAFSCDALFIHGLEIMPRAEARAFIGDFLLLAAGELRPGGIILLIEKLSGAPLFRESLLPPPEFVWAKTEYFPPAKTGGENKAKPLIAVRCVRSSAFLLA